MELPPEEGKVRDEEKISDPVTAAGDVNVKKESCDACVQDACTQTPPRTQKRRGGCGSRRRRMLAFQLRLTERLGLPLSCLLCLKETDAKSPRGKAKRLEEESTSALLEDPEVKVKQEKLYEGGKEEDVSCSSAGTSNGGPTLFTPRSCQSGVLSPSLPSSTSFLLALLSTSLLQSSTVWPDALAPVGDMWGMSVMGHCPTLCCDVMRSFVKP